MPTDEKPLMIRGDRLLLALDVLKFVVYHSRAENPRNFTEGALGEFIEKVFPRLTNSTAYRYYAIFNDLHVLLKYATGLQKLKLNLKIVLLICIPWGIHVSDSSIEIADLREIKKFFEMIASGELTEANFR